MKRIAAFVFVLLVVSCNPFEPSIRWDEAYKHIGETRTVCGVVSHVTILDGVSYTLSLGDSAYEDSYGSLVRTLSGKGMAIRVMAYDIKNFSLAPDVYNHQAICARGKIELTLGQVGMLISNQGQIEKK